MLNVYRPISDFKDELSLDSSSLALRNFPTDRYALCLGIYPETLIFTDILIDTESYQQTILIRNIGIEKVIIDNLIIVGNFIIKSDLPTLIEPNDTFEVSIAFKPISIIEATGGLYIDANTNGDRFIKFTGTSKTS